MAGAGRGRPHQSRRPRRESRASGGRSTATVRATVARIRILIDPIEAVRTVPLPSRSDDSRAGYRAPKWCGAGSVDLIGCTRTPSAADLLYSGGPAPEPSTVSLFPFHLPPATSATSKKRAEKRVRVTTLSHSHSHSHSQSHSHYYTRTYTPTYTPTSTLAPTPTLTLTLFPSEK